MIPLAILGVAQLVRDEFLEPEIQQKYRLSELLGWLPDWPYDRYFLIALVIAFVFLLHGAYRQHSKVVHKLKSRIDERHTRKFDLFEKEHDELRSSRRIYWKTLRGVYAQLRATHTAWPEELEDVVALAQFPDEIIGGNPIGWAGKARRTLSGESKILWTLAQSIYPENQKDESALSDQELDDFDFCEGTLSNFWQKVGGWAFGTKELKAEALLIEKRYFPSQSNLLKMLAYFECALMWRVKTPGPGKQRMMEVYMYAKQHEGN